MYSILFFQKSILLVNKQITTPSKEGDNVEGFSQLRKSKLLNPEPPAIKSDLRQLNAPVPPPSPADRHVYRRRDSSFIAVSIHQES